MQSTKLMDSVKGSAVASICKYVDCVKKNKYLVCGFIGQAICALVYIIIINWYVTWRVIIAYLETTSRVDGIETVGARQAG